MAKKGEAFVAKRQMSISVDDEVMEQIGILMEHYGTHDERSPAIRKCIAEKVAEIKREKGGT